MLFFIAYNVVFILNDSFLTFETYLKALNLILTYDNVLSSIELINGKVVNYSISLFSRIIKIHKFFEEKKSGKWQIVQTLSFIHTFFHLLQTKY